MVWFEAEVDRLGGGAAMLAELEKTKKKGTGKQMMQQKQHTGVISH